MKDAVLTPGEAHPDNADVSAEPSVREKKSTDWWGETKGVFWLILVVLGFHSFIAKPFYIPSESMLPGLEVGDRLVVNKFAYGWSFVSPTIPNPVAIFEGFVLRRAEDSYTFRLPFRSGRLLGSLPERGDVVIVTPPGKANDYIKRVIGLPGDRLEVRGGVVILNGVPVKRGPLHYVNLRDYGGTLSPENTFTCTLTGYPQQALFHGADGRPVCRLPVITETLPNGRRYDTVDLGDTYADTYAAITIPKGRVFLMGDNRDNSADSRFPLEQGGLGGPVPYENLGGRAEFITFSLDGTAGWNPLTWFESFRPGRAGRSLHPERVQP